MTSPIADQLKSQKDLFQGVTSAEYRLRSPKHHRAISAGLVTAVYQDAVAEHANAADGWSPDLEAVKHTPQSSKHHRAISAALAKDVYGDVVAQHADAADGWSPKLERSKDQKEWLAQIDREAKAKNVQNRLRRHGLTASAFENPQDFAGNTLPAKDVSDTMVASRPESDTASVVPSPSISPRSVDENPKSVRMDRYGAIAADRSPLLDLPSLGRGYGPIGDGTPLLDGKVNLIRRLYRKYCCCG